MESPHFHSRPTNSTSYESWHIPLKFHTLLRLLGLKLRPREVAEVARVQEKKKIDQKFWNLQFLSYTNFIHIKRKLRPIFIQIWNKIRGFCYEKVEKKICDFLSQKIIISARSRLNFWKTCQDSKKMTWLPCSWDVYG